MRAENEAAEIRRHFAELMADHSPHKINEITNYVQQKMQEDGYESDKINSTRAYLSILPILRDSDSGYIRTQRGYYQKLEAPLIENHKGIDPWTQLLDKAMELRNLVEQAFDGENPLPNATDEESSNFHVIGQALLNETDLILDQYSAWLAIMDDHVDQQSALPEMTQSM